MHRVQAARGLFHGAIANIEDDALAIAIWSELGNLATLVLHPDAPVLKTRQWGYPIIET